MTCESGVAVRTAPAAMLVSAWLSEVEEDDGFQASVFIPTMPTTPPVVRLSAALRDSSHEGRVFRWALDRIIEHQPGLHFYAEATTG